MFKRYISLLIVILYTMTIFSYPVTASGISDFSDTTNTTDNSKSATSSSNDTITVPQSVYSIKNDEVQSDRFLIKFKSENPGIEKKISQKVKRFKKVKSKESKLALIELKEKISKGSIEQELKDFMGDIEFVQPDYKVTLNSNDPMFEKQWGLKAVTQDVYGVGNQNLFQSATGNGVIVAVADTGIDITHEDIKGNIYVNSQEILVNGIDDDNNGYIDDVSGWNFTDDTSSVHSSDTILDEKHGTHIAGIIGSIANNKKGISGVAPNSRILPLKIFKNGTAYTSDIIESINYAEKMGAKVFNCSWGSSDSNPALRDSIINSKLTFVCSAGNSSTNIDISPIYPASYDLPNVIPVGAIDRNGNISSFSNYGKNVIFAPGSEIISTTPENQYDMMSGTSMSAGFVAGYILKLLELDLTLTPKYIKEKTFAYFKKDIVFPSAELNSVSISVYSPNNSQFELYASTLTASSVTTPSTTVNNSKFKIYANNVTSSLGNQVTAVKFATWTTNNGQDDLFWHEGKYLGNNNWECEITISSHLYESGEYTTHVYAYDNLGNNNIIGGTIVNIPPPVKATSITNSGTPVNSNSFKLYANTVTSNWGNTISSVKFPTWTTNNGQDDLVWHDGTYAGNNTWVCDINVNQHKNEPGEYLTHIYGYDSQGNSSIIGTSLVYVNAVKATSITLSSNPVNAKTFKVYANNVTSNLGNQITSVMFPTWTTFNGQDELVWHQGKSLGNNNWECEISNIDHKNEYGEYSTHVYAYDDKGNTKIIGVTLAFMNNPIKALSITNSGTPTGNSTFKVTANAVTSNWGNSITSVKFPTWTDRGGQDDIVWHEGKNIGNNTWECEINIADHKNEQGNYTIHVYGYDNQGNVNMLGGTCVKVLKSYYEYIYDGNGRLSQIIFNEVPQLKFDYDSNGNCIKKYKP